MLIFAETDGKVVEVLQVFRHKPNNRTNRNFDLMVVLDKSQGITNMIPTYDREGSLYHI